MFTCVCMMCFMFYGIKAHLRDKTHACPRFVKSTLDRIGVRSHLIHDEESDVANTMTQMTRVSPFDTDESQHAYAPTTHDGPSSHPPLDESTQANHAPQPRDSDSTSETSSETSETSSYSESSFVPSDHPVCTPSRLKFPTRKCATSLHHTLPHVSAFSPLQNTAHPCNGTASDAAMVAGDDHDDDDDETTYYTSVDSDAVPTHAEPTLLNVPDVSEHEPVPVATRKRKRDDDGLSANEVFRLHARKLEIDREMKLEVLALQREQFEHYRQMHTLQFNFVMWQYKMHLEMEKAYIATTRDIAP